MTKLYFAYVEDLYTLSIAQMEIEVKDDEPHKRYQLPKMFFSKEFPTTYVRYDEIGTIIYPRRSCAVGYTKIAALKTLKAALKEYICTVKKSIAGIDDMITKEREVNPATAVV